MIVNLYLGFLCQWLLLLLQLPTPWQPRSRQRLVSFYVCLGIHFASEMMVYLSFYVPYRLFCFSATQDQSAHLLVHFLCSDNRVTDNRAPSLHCSNWVHPHHHPALAPRKESEQQRMFPLCLWDILRQHHYSWWVVFSRLQCYITKMDLLRWIS